MEPTTPETWKAIMEDDFNSMHKMIDDLKDSLKGADGQQAIAYYNPLKQIIFEAAMDAGTWKRRIREIGDDIIKSI